MSAYKKPEKNEEEYSFIQEHVMPRTKNTKKKYFRYLCVTIVLGIVFGIVSSATLNISNHVLGKCKKEEPVKPISLEDDGQQKNSGKTQLTDVQDTASNKIQVAEKIQDNKIKEHLTDEEVSRLMGIKSYERFYTLMRDLFDETKQAMVSVLSVSEAASWFGVENIRTSYGLILKKDENSIYVLCNYNEVKDVGKIRVEFFNEEVVKAQLMD
ncbi:MAG: hypothetical protein IKL07_07265, partial [Clostridium sp.]|nr:hypothetical protein [Clostridium sp.]